MPNDPAPQPFQVTLGDGSVVKAENIEEAFKKVAAMKEDTHAALKQEREQREAMQQQLTDLQSKVAAATAPQRTNGQQQFDNNEYFTLLNKDPIAAQNYLDAYRFGIATPEQVPQHFQQLSEDVGKMRQESVASQFLLQHSDDYPHGDPKAAEALTNRVSQLYNSGYPLDTSTLNFAYGQLITEGAIKPVEAEAVEQADEPNPSLGGGGGTMSQTELTKAENMSDTELKTFLEQRGLLQR